MRGQELNEERTAFEREVLSKNEQITDLKEKLQEKKTETAIELRYLGKESKVCGSSQHCHARARRRALIVLKLLSTTRLWSECMMLVQAKFNCTQRVREKVVRDLEAKIKLIEDELAIEQHANGM